MDEDLPTKVKSPKSPQVKPKAPKASKPPKEDNYKPDILRESYHDFMEYRLKIQARNEKYKLQDRVPNLPEGISENIVKNIIQNKEKDFTCQWSKALGKPGDLCSERYPLGIEVKAFTSDGPSSFGPKKKFGVIYFLNMSNMDRNQITLWKVPLTHESPEWKNLKMSKSQTNEDQCNEGRRPRISWEKIHTQLGDIPIKIYDGTFEDIFTAPLGVSI